MSTEIQNAIYKLENEINDLIMIGENRGETNEFLPCCPKGQCNCIRYPERVEEDKARKCINIKNTRKKDPSKRSKSFHQSSTSGIIEKSNSMPSSVQRKTTSAKLVKTCSKKLQSKYMCNKSSSMVTSKIAGIPNSNIDSISVSSDKFSPIVIRSKSKSVPPQDDKHSRRDELALIKEELSKVKSQLSFLKNSQTVIAEKKIDELSVELQSLKRENKALNEAYNQKKQEFEQSTKNLVKVQELLTVYGEKVGLLHEKAIVSSKVMNESKEKFCKCLQEKDRKIKKLLDTIKSLKKDIEKKNKEISELHSKLIVDPSNELTILKDTNEIYCDCIKKLEGKLQLSMEDCERFKNQISSCNERLETMDQILGQKCNCTTTYTDEIKRLQENETKLYEEVSFLTQRIGDMETEKLEKQVATDFEIGTMKRDYDDLNNKYSDLMDKYEEYEKCARKCEVLERECQSISTEMQEKESVFQNERHVLRTLVDELTNVVNQNKHTLLHLSQVNQDQEEKLNKQNQSLEEKEQRIREVTSEYEVLKKRSDEMEKEMVMIASKLSDSDKVSCADMREKVLELMEKLDTESENVKIKNQVIEDQTKTIENLQQKLQEHTKEIKKSKEEVNKSLGEILELNMALKEKEDRLGCECREKDKLLDKLRHLENHKNQLVNQMDELEAWIKECFKSSVQTEIDTEELSDMQDQIENLRRLWVQEKSILCEEKEKATSAARFATQKLVETISDFQKQVAAQKKVQNMLTTMLQQKEEQLRLVKEKMSSISALTYVCDDKEIPVQSVQQLYKNLCTTSTNGSFTTCSENPPGAHKKKHSKKGHCSRCSCK